MSRPAIFALDLLAIGILTMAIYFPRYRRRDMVLAYLGLNVGVMAVAVALTVNTSIGTGFGLGLFGTLSIIRLRSSELAHQEIAYYFAALALGLLGGIEVTPDYLSALLPGVVVLVMFIGDHPRLYRGYRRQTVTLGRAITDEKELTKSLAELLNATVHHIELLKLDMVNDTTVVDVRYRLTPQAVAAEL
jgi:Domain of unknown function (DUF4956)